MVLALAAGAEAATLEGRIVAGDGIEEPAALSVAIDDWICGKDGKTPDPRLVIGLERGLANVVVRVRSVGDAPPYAADGKALIDQQGCVFVPHVSVVAPGQEVVVRNSDRVLHNFRTTAEHNRKVNKAQTKGKEDVLRFATPEIIGAECDVHYWMSAVVVVAPNAFVAVTGADGSFKIEGLPAKRHEIELWHETLGTRTTTAEVGEGADRSEFTWPAPAPAE